MSNLRDITGMIFGDWKVIEFDNEGIWSNFKEKLWGGHLWNPSYFIATVSENTEEQIIKYIKSQKEK